jgi:parvulin-like peptidyl-prolyl isomerase
MMVLDSLQKGGNFEDLALAYSKDPSVVRNRGDIGYVMWGQLTMPFLEAAFKLEPGQISQPFETKFGWHIAKVTDRVPNENRKSYDFMRRQIEQQIKNIQRDSLMDTFLTELRENHPVSIEEATVEYLMHKRQTLYPPQLLESLPKNDFDMAQLDRHEKELVLATWDDGQMTLGQYLTQIQQVPMEARPDLDNYQALAEFIFQMNVMDLLSAEAKRRGLEDDPEYKRKLKRFKELTMADVMENDSIPISNPPTEEEVRQYYDEHLDEFIQPPQVHVFEILVSSQDTAQKYAREIRSLKKFKEVASRVTERPGKRITKGDLGYIQRNYYPPIYDLAYDSPVGSVVGPVGYADQFSVIYVADKKAEEMKDFLMVKPQINAKIERELKREAFEQWVENKKEEVDIRLYENNVRPGIDKTKYIEADET